MKLAEAKRRVKVGMTLQAVGHYNPRVTGPRVVTSISGAGFGWDYDGAPQRTHWPLARNTTDDGPDAITLLFDESVLEHHSNKERRIVTLTFPSVDGDVPEYWNVVCARPTCGHRMRFHGGPIPECAHCQCGWFVAPDAG